MPLNELLVDAVSQLEEIGDCITLTGNLAADSYNVGHDVYRLADGIDYDVVLTNTGGAILLTGIARAQATGECARCLEEAVFDIAGEVEGYYLLPGSDVDTSGDDERGADEFDHVDEKGQIDLSVPLLAALVIETPVVLLCREDCRGLCPQCGANLNEGDCEHVGAVEEVDDDNPFAVLKNLSFDD